MAEQEPRKLIVAVRIEDGWMTAYLDLGGEESELCRIVSPPRHAKLRVEILEAFQKLASTILESIVREDYPDAEFSTTVVNMPPAGRG